MPSCERHVLFIVLLLPPKFIIRRVSALIRCNRPYLSLRVHSLIRATKATKWKLALREPLVDSHRILLPPLHIKLGLSMQFTKALNKEGSCFHYLCNVFPSLSTEKVKAGIFDGPQIRQLIKDKHFENSMEANKQNAWKCFVLVVKNFLGSMKAENYKDLVSNMIDAFKDLECNMSINLHFLYSHNEKFPENLGSMSDEQGEWSHQDIKEMEIRYQGRWDAAKMADYCWSLKRDIVDAAHSRNAKKREFRP